MKALTQDTDYLVVYGLEKVLHLLDTYSIYICEYDDFVEYLISNNGNDSEIKQATLEITERGNKFFKSDKNSIYFISKFTKI
jgi:hypothetical protein